MNLFRFSSLAFLTLLLTGLFRSEKAQAVPVELNVDAGNEGLATSVQNPLASGVVEAGWLTSGTTLAEMVNFLNSRDFASARSRFNSVTTVTFSPGSANSFGDGHIFENKILVPDGDAVALAAYKNPATGAAGKTVFLWVRNAGSEGSASQQAFVQTISTFATANDNVNFTDYAATASTDSTALPPANVGIGTLANIIVGSGMDTNGGSPADGQSLYGATKVLQTAEFSSTATLAFSNATASVTENAATLTLTVTRSGKTDSTVTVQYSTANGSATAGTDYTAATGTLTFAPNDNSESIVIPIVDRPGFQGDRMFAVNLASPGAGAELGSPAAVAVTITDDDIPMPGQLVLSSATYSAAENGGTVAVTVRRTGGSDGTVSANFATANGSASSGSDYTAVSQAVTFAAGDAADKVIAVPILNDSTFEGDETFTVSISAAEGGATLGSPSSATVTITEDDAPPSAGALSFTAASYSTLENAGTVTISVQRTQGSTGAVGVAFATADGTATAPADYTTTSGVLSWAAGDSAIKTFMVPINDNLVDAADKSFTVMLSNATGGAATAAPSTATVVITDNDNAGSLQWSTAASTVSENAGNATLTITRTGGTDGSVSVVVNTANGSAIAGTDYTAVSNSSVTLGNGVASATVTVPITDNATYSGDRSFSVNLSSPTGGAALGTPAAQTVTILEDETASAGALAFTSSSYTVDEGAGTATITVVRSGGSDSTVTVNYAATAGTAGAGDFTETMGTLTFAPGITQQTFTVAINNDGTVEPNETVNLSLSNATGGATLGSPSAATLSIVSDDQPPTIQLSAPVYSGNEGEIVNLVVQRSGTTGETVTVNYTTRDGTAKSGIDYKRASGTLTFGPDETEKTVAIQLKEDSVGESTENFHFKLSLPSASTAQLGDPSKATIKINRSDAVDQPDNSVAAGSGRFAGKDVYNTTGNGQIASRSVSPGGSASFTLRVANNGNVSDAFRVVAVPSGTANGAEARISYRGRDVTNNITDTDGLTTPTLGTKDSVEFQVTVKFSGGRADTGYGVTFTTTSIGTSTAVDVARVLAIVRE